MLTRRYRHLAVFGGLASLLILAYAPFIQDLIAYEIQYTPQDGSTKDAPLSYATNYTASDQSHRTCSI